MILELTCLALLLIDKNYIQSSADRFAAFLALFSVYYYLSLKNKSKNAVC